jgi:hypothetical protein
MSPRLRTHLVTAGVFAVVVAVVFAVWSLRNLLLYILLGVVALLVYWGLYLLVSSRLRARHDEEADRRGEADWRAEGDRRGETDWRGEGQ